MGDGETEGLPLWERLRGREVEGVSVSEGGEREWVAVAVVDVVGLPDLHDEQERVQDSESELEPETAGERLRELDGEAVGVCVARREGEGVRDAVEVCVPVCVANALGLGVGVHVREREGEGESDAESERERLPLDVREAKQLRV